MPGLLLAGMALWVHAAAGQGGTIDQVAATVGNRIILKSDIETQYQQYISQGNYPDSFLKCRIIDQLLYTKLLLNQAVLDSVEVNDAEVQDKLDRNLDFYMEQLGSQEKLEEFYGKTVAEIKDEYEPLIREQLMVQAMQGRITRDVAVTPADVRSFYASIPPDSLPYINSEIEYAQIRYMIPVGAEEKSRIRGTLEKYRERIRNGEELSTLAVLYSQDGSAKKGGELGFHGRGDLVPEFEAVAFRLKPGEVSGVVETKFGYHLIQMIERRGERINVRHILLRPTVTGEDLQAAHAKMDSVYRAIADSTLSFADAAEKFSDDTDTRNNGGLVFNPGSATTRFAADQVDPAVFFQLEKLNPGEVSEPVTASTREGKQGYFIYKLISRSDPHRANLEKDYQRLQEVALEIKKNEALEKWVRKKKRNTYISIAPEYRSCENLDLWLN